VEQFLLRWGHTCKEKGRNGRKKQINTVTRKADTYSETYMCTVVLSPLKLQSNEGFWKKSFFLKKEPTWQFILLAESLERMIINCEYVSDQS